MHSFRDIGANVVRTPILRADVTLKIWKFIDKNYYNLRKPY